MVFLQDSDFGLEVHDFELGDSRSLVLGLGSRDSGLGSRVSGFGSRVSGLGTRASRFGIRASSLGSRVSGFGFRIWSFPVSDLRFRVSGFGCTVLARGRVAEHVQEPHLELWSRVCCAYHLP